MKPARPKDPHWKNPDKHGDRYDKMNEGSTSDQRPKGKPGKKKPFKPNVQQNLKTGKVQHG